ncbi:uncharacterized protein LOC133883429 [Phragmites australis]|uniref:uncharacterized protein LOC133883429 n=1 Tax=Phragmites australis TaxID=29695 RepID=UPI002D78C690|nr:uncharacterized protein LOC133883429 [Phragmites australis]
MAQGQTQEQEPPPVYDVNRLQLDPGLRVSIASYHINDQDAIRRGYILKGLCQPYAHEYKTRKIYGYDGASNMKGEINVLKTLIMKESPSAYYIHCFAHQLQLVLVAVAKGNDGCVWFFAQLSCLLNIVGVSCKRHDMLRNVRAQKLKTALELGEIESGSGLNQEMGLARPGDIRWGSHYKTILHIIDMYSTIREVLIILGKDPTQRGDWPNIHAMVDVFESFEFVFNAHLMLVILGYTNELCQSLQKRDQDIVNAMSLVSLAKERMQHMGSHGWEEFFKGKVTSFCVKYSIIIPSLDGNYVPHGRSSRFYPEQTIDDHYRREVYLDVIDKIRQELDNRFDEVNMELLLCMSALNPFNSFASYDAHKILRLAKFYPKDISSMDLIRLEIQLDNFIHDMRRDDRFKCLNNLGELSIRLVETNKHTLYDLVYLLLKLVLILPVATASVERVFSALSLVKNKLRNSMGDELLNDCLVTFIERDVFCKISEDDIIESFMVMRKRRVEF